MKPQIVALVVSCTGFFAATAAVLGQMQVLVVLAVVLTAACGWAGTVLAPHDRRVVTGAVLVGAAVSLAAQGAGWPVARTAGAGALVVGASLVSLFGSILFLPSLRVNTTAFIAGTTLVVAAMAGAASWGAGAGPVPVWWPVAAGCGAAGGGLAALVPPARVALVAALASGGVVGAGCAVWSAQVGVGGGALVGAACAVVVAALLVGSRRVVAATPGWAVAVLVATGGLGATAALAQSVAMLT